MLFALLCGVSLTLGQDSPSSVREELASFYQTQKMPAKWDASITNLAVADKDARQKAAAHLVELMEQSWRDEESGKAPWLATPFWGGRMENPARNLRSTIVTALEKTPAAPETLPVVQWLLRKEPQMDLQASVVGFLGKIDGAAADEYRRAQILQPHPNAVVMGMLLAQAQERRLTLPAARLKELCHHHRKLIRDGARKLNESLKGADPGPFDPLQALKSPAVRRTLDDLQALMIDLPSKETPFVEVTVRYLEKNEVKRTHKAQGWLLKEDKSEIQLYTPYGQHDTYRDKENTKITVGKPIENGYTSWQIDVITNMSVAKVDISGYVKEVSGIRAKGNQEFELSPRGGLTGQFQGQSASVPEAILTGWLDRAGKPDQTAAILFPALDTLYEDRSFVEMASHRLGDLYGYRMLVAFAGDRDYGQTLKLARTLVKTYPGTQFFEYAEGLVEQLPRRMDDFNTLKLPTPKDWAEMKKKMSRREQLDFLCQRLRLLNCFQLGQPGGYSAGSTQYAEPCGISANAAWGLNKGKTEVINPYSELTGERGFFVDGKDKGLDLKISDIPALAPYLREDWYLPTVSFWRDFHPARTLSRSRTYFAGLINGLAQRDLCELNRFDKMPAKEQETHLKKIIAWAEANKNKSEEALLIDAVKTELDRKASWHKVSDRVEALVKMKSPQALAFVEHYLRSENESDYNIPTLLTHVETLDKQKAIEWSKKLLNHKSARVRMQSAMTVFDSGNQDLVLPILAELLRKGSSYDLGGHAEQAVDRLLKLGTKPAIDAARGILSNKYLRLPRTGHPGADGLIRSAIIPRLAKVGYPEGFEIYLELLDVQGNQFGEAAYGTPVAKLVVDEILQDYSETSTELKKIRELKDFEQQRIVARRWIEAKLDRPKIEK